MIDHVPRSLPPTLLLLVAVALAGCAPDVVRPRARPPLAEPVEPPTRVGRPRPPAPPPRAVRPDTAPLTAKIDPATPAGRAAALRLTEQGRRELAAGAVERAIQLFERAIAVEARVPYAYYLLAEAHRRAGRPRLALSFLDRAEQKLGGEPYWLAETRTLRGEVLEDEGRTRAARRAYRGALEAWPESRRAADGLARLRRAAGSRR